MKLKLYKALYVPALIVLASLNSSRAQLANSLNDIPQPLVPQQNFHPVNDALPETANSSWLSAAGEHIRKMQYSFKPQQNPGAFKVVNTPNRVQFSVTHKGYTVSNVLTENDNEKWEATFELLGVGRNKNMWTPGNRYLTESDENILRYIFPSVDVEYINDENGVRQNFFVRKKMKGEGPLVIQMRINGNLIPRLLHNNRLSLHTKSDSIIRLYYEDLKVWDENNKMLSAKMQLDVESKTISIIIDDKNAAYPITVDPLNKTPNWQTSANGVLPALLNNLALQVQTLYGYTVAGLGDVNNDGYDDVAVGAPGMADVVSGSGSLLSVGAVFVYFGSATGLPVAPSKVLQPNTAVSGALFGFSIASGDITGDGIKDIIVGAPMDHADIDFGGGTGIINGRVGKVYAFQGGTLSGSNPSPILSLSLNSPLLTTSTITLNPLFGFSISVTGDMNNDTKGEIIVGSPAYARIDGAATVKTGGAFVYLSDASNTFSTIKSLEPPTGSVLGLYGAVQTIVQAVPITGGLLWAVAGPLLSDLLNGQIEGLLFGFSVDGAGNYDNDGIPDVVVGAPAGVNLGNISSGLGLSGVVSGLLSGQILGGSAYVFHGTATAAGVNTTPVARLQAAPSGLLSNAANLFGYKVKAVTNNSSVPNGNILVGSPNASVLSNVVGGLQVKAGSLYVFKKKTGAITNPVVSDQSISSPRSSSILSILAGKTINVSLLYASAMDNTLDLNCDGFADLIVGEPLSTSAGVIGVDAVGGAAYIYLGQADGLYNPVPAWSLYSDVSGVVGLNATALIGYSVAGARHYAGPAIRPSVLVGGPTNSLDFGSGLLNLGTTMSTLLSFVADGNGLGKAFNFDAALCSLGTLPVTITDFTGRQRTTSVELNWKTTDEVNIASYEVQKSTDGTTFHSLGVVLPPEKATANSYSLLDKNPVTGNNYYRLKIIDKGSGYKYSHVILVRYNVDFKGEMVVSPNPVKEVIRIRFTGMDKGSYRLELRTVSGQLLRSSTATIALAEQFGYMARPASIVPGVYFLTIYNKENTRVSTTRIFVE